MTSTARFDNWQNRLGTQAGSIDASGNVTFDNDVTVTGGATVSGDLAVTGNVTSANQGLILVKTQTIGSAVSSVTVSDAFSADYDNYKIIISIDNSSTSFAELKLSLGGITFNYYSGGLEVFWGAFSSFTNHFTEGPEANFKIGYQDSGATVCIVELQNPFSSTSRTSISALQSPRTGSLTMMGFVDSIASATSVIISPDSGTISGGTIRVYGYNNG